jgi:hypothetical protein
MLAFRCWYCNRLHSAPEKSIGAVRRCGCGNKYRVPPRGDGDSTYRTFTDRMVEALVYSFGGALIGFVTSLVIVRALVLTVRRGGFPLYIILGFTLTGFLFGLIFGEWGITALGRWARGREEETRWR